MLDVGQGLSVLVSQGDRALLFDTGDRYPGGYNMADAAIFPMLEYREYNNSTIWSSVTGIKIMRQTGRR